MEILNPHQKRIMELADNMAAAAAMFNAHGYDNFINAREQLKAALSEVVKVSGDSIKRHM